MKEIEDEEQFETLVAEAGSKGKLMVVCFSATWCGPCNMIKGTLNNIVDEHKDVLFYKVDVDELEDLASEFNLNCMPTFIFFKNGKEIKDERMMGTNTEKLREAIIKLKSN